MNSAPNTGQSSIVLSDSTGAALARSFAQVLQIVSLNAATTAPGGFFPKGVNGPIQG